MASFKKVVRHDIFFRSPRFSLIAALPPPRALLINNVLGSRRVAASAVAAVATKEKKKGRERKKIFFHRASEKLLMKPADATYGCIQLGPTSASMRDTPVLSFLSVARADPPAYSSAEIRGSISGIGDRSTLILDRTSCRGKIDRLGMYTFVYEERKWIRMERCNYIRNCESF